jgi:hypothetical protein
VSYACWSNPVNERERCGTSESERERRRCRIAPQAVTPRMVGRRTRRAGEVNWLSDESAPVLSRSVHMASLLVVIIAEIVSAGG